MQRRTIWDQSISSGPSTRAVRGSVALNPPPVLTRWNRLPSRLWAVLAYGASYRCRAGRRAVPVPKMLQLNVAAHCMQGHTEQTAGLFRRARSAPRHRAPGAARKGRSKFLRPWTRTAASVRAPRDRPCARLLLRRTEPPNVHAHPAVLPARPRGSTAQ